MTTFNINQLTDNIYNDINPQISELGNVVWESEVSSSKYELYYYNNSLQQTISLSNSFFDQSKSNPQISADLVVYEYEYAANDHDIYLFNSNDSGGTLNFSIATSAYNETNPQIAGNFIVYERELSADNHDIYLLKIERSDNGITIDSSNTVSIASSANNETNPQIAGNFVIYDYEVNADNHDIYLYEIESGKTIIVANQLNNETNAHVSDTGDVVYEYNVDANNTDIKLYDYLTGNTTTLGGSTYDELNPQIASNYVTWQAWDGNDWEIYRYNSVDKITTQVTSNNVNDTNPQISEIGYVVWEQDYLNSGNINLKLFDGYENIDLANSSYNEINPQITGNYVSWQAWDGNDWEVYSADVIA